MPALSPDDRRVAEAIAGIASCNPFSERRIALERAALGSQFKSGRRAISWEPGETRHDWFPNAEKIGERAHRLADRMREAILQRQLQSPEDMELYQDVALYYLYYSYMSPFWGHIAPYRDRETGYMTDVIEFWEDFNRYFRHYFNLPGLTLPDVYEPEHILAGFYQIERAFFRICYYLIGNSQPSVALRAAVWDSIFTRDIKRYARGAYRHMRDIPTLITGPSGTGKELVARAIGLAQYIRSQNGLFARAECPSSAGKLSR